MNKNRICGFLYNGTEKVILVFYAVFITSAFLRASAFDFEWSGTLRNGLRALFLAVIVIRYISGWISFGFKDKTKTLILAVLALTMFVTRLFNDVGSFIDVGLLLLALKDIDYRRIIKLFMICICVLLLLGIIASCSGWVENYNSFHGFKIRYAFGTLSALDFSAYFFFLELCWIFLRRSKLKAADFIVIAAVIAALVWLCDARTSALAMAAAWAAALILKLRSSYLSKRGQENARLLPAWIIWILAFAVCICAIFIIGATYLYSEDSRISVILNGALNDRLALGKQGMDTYGFSLFGKVIETVGVPGLSDYFFIDSSYVFTLLRYGLVTFLGAMAIFQVQAISSARKKDVWSTAVIALAACHFIMEHHMLQIQFDPFIFMICASGGALSPEGSGSCAQQKADLSLIRKSKMTAAVLCVIAAAFAATTVYALITCGSDPRYDIYETVVRTPSGRYDTIQIGENVAQGVLLPKDICGIDIMFANDGDEIGEDLIWSITGELEGYDDTEVIPKENIKAGEYTRIISDSSRLLAWNAYCFTFSSESGKDVNAAVASAEPSNDFCGGILIDGELVDMDVMNFDLVYRYNDIRMMIWIFELLILISAVFAASYNSGRNV